MTWYDVERTVSAGSAVNAIRSGYLFTKLNIRMDLKEKDNSQPTHNYSGSGRLVRKQLPKLVGSSVPHQEGTQPRRPNRPSTATGFSVPRNSLPQVFPNYSELWHICSRKFKVLYLLQEGSSNILADHDCVLILPVVKETELGNKLIWSLEVELDFQAQNRQR